MKLKKKTYVSSRPHTLVNVKDKKVIISSNQLVPIEMNILFFQNFANGSSCITDDPERIQHLVEKAIFKFRNHLNVLLINNKAGAISYLQK